MMGLRVYFNVVRLREQSSDTGLTQSQYHADRKPTLQTAENDDWCYFMLYGVRIQHDWSVGLPYIEMKCWETMMESKPWSSILNSDAAEHIIITETWEGTQPAGKWRNLAETAENTCVVLTRQGKNVSAELRLDPIPGRETARILSGAWESIRTGKFGSFREHMPYDL